MPNNKAGKILRDIISGKAPGRGAANPNFPDDSNVNPVYSRNSGNPPIDQGFNNNPMSKKLTNWAKKNKRTFLPDTKRK